MLIKTAVLFRMIFAVQIAIAVPLLAARHEKSSSVVLSLEFEDREEFSELSDCWAVSIVNYLIGKRLALPESEVEFEFTSKLSLQMATLPLSELSHALEHTTYRMETFGGIPFDDGEIELAKEAAYDYLAGQESEVFSSQSEEVIESSGFLEFFTESIHCLKNISAEKIGEIFSMLQPGDAYHISYAVQDTLSLDGIASLIGLGEEGSEKDEVAEEIVAKEAQPLATDPFTTLSVSAWEADTIKKIINTMGDKNVVQLLMKKKELKKMGKKIHHVHPLKFLEVVFTHSRTAHSMKEVKKNGFKWDAFMDGISEKIEDELSQGNFIPYIPGFCETLQVDQDTVMRYVTKHDWKQLVSYLIKVK